MRTCPECGKRLPWGTAYSPGGGFGLPDKRSLDCPYCGAPLEPIRWTAVAGLILMLAAAIAARKLLEPVLAPLLNWKTLIVLLTLVAAHHIWVLRKRKKTFRKRDAPGRLAGRD